MGNGWNDFQKFQMGMNPNVFYTPPAPQGLMAFYNGNSGMATVSWLPSSGNVTGYLVTRTDWWGNKTNFQPVFQQHQFSG